MRDGIARVAQIAHAARNARPNDAAFLTSRARLDEAGLRVVGADVYGRGPTARVDLRLSEGRPLTFERFGDLAKPAALAAHLVTEAGVWRTFKGPEAGAIAAAVFRLAEHRAEAEGDENARELGGEFLRLAGAIDVDLADQAERWRAFSALARMEPAHDAGEDRSAWALARASAVLRDAGGLRYVRCGWFAAYARREVGGVYSPATLAVQMKAVGWRRRGSEGRIMARCPGDRRSLVWTFYEVPAGWEDGGDDC
jgi:hypothetical protein